MNLLSKQQLVTPVAYRGYSSPEEESFIAEGNDYLLLCRAYPAIQYVQEMASGTWYVLRQGELRPL